MTGKHVKRVSVEIGIKVTALVPASVGVRVIARTGAVVNAIFGTFADHVFIWIGIGMSIGSIPGSGKIVRDNKSQFHGKSNGEKLLLFFS